MGAVPWRTPCIGSWANWLHGFNKFMETKSWSKRRALSLCDQPVACCHNSKSALEHVSFLLCKVAYDWRTSWSLAKSNWLYLVMLECILASVVPEALTFLHKKQNFNPESPLEPHTCFCAAPSARTIPKSKWNLMVVSVFGSFKMMPVCGKLKGLQKMDFKRLAVIWLTPASNLDTLVLLAKAMVSQLCMEDKWLPSSKKLQYQAHDFLSARPKTLPGTNSSKYTMSFQGCWGDEGHLAWTLERSCAQLPPLANKAIKYVSRLVKTNGTGSPSLFWRTVSWIKGPKSPPWHSAMVCLLASLWCLGVLKSGKPISLASSIIACKLDWLWNGRLALKCCSLANFSGLEEEAMAGNVKQTGLSRVQVWQLLGVITQCLALWIDLWLVNIASMADCCMPSQNVCWLEADGGGCTHVMEAPQCNAKAGIILQVMPYTGSSIYI